MMKSVLAWAGCLLLCGMVPPEDNQPARGQFHRNHLQFTGKRQDYVIYDFNGDQRYDILVISINFDDDPPTRWFSLFLQRPDGQFKTEPDQLWPISIKACALVFGRFIPEPTTPPVHKSTQICFIARDGVYAYRWKDNRMDETPQKLFHSETFFSEPSDISIPVLYYMDDLDANGLDDLILPLHNGYKIYLQTEPGKFGKVSQIQIDPDRYPFVHQRKAAAFIAYREMPKLEAVDINGDGRKDLVAIRDNLISTYFQDAEGKFAAAPRQTRIRALFESTDKNRIDLSFVTLTDLNNDKMADLAVTKITGTLGLFESMQSYVYIYFGNGSGRFIHPDCALKIDGVTLPPEYVDLDQDSFKDIIVTSVPTHLLEAGKIALLQSVSITYMICTYKAHLKRYDASVDFSRAASVSIKEVEKSMMGGVPLLYFRGDHDGDQRPDMIMLQTDKTLEIRRGETYHHIGGGVTPDYSKDTYFKTTLDSPPKGLQVIDLNGDKRDDIVLIYNGALELLISEK